MSTIYALTTPISRSAVAIIRLSGVLCDRVLEDLGCDSLPDVRMASLRKLRAIKRGGHDDVMDEALILRFKAPHSFTGEDVIELHTHGSIAVIKDILAYLGSLDYLTMAEAGEFSRRAFENGRMDLTQVEGLADLIDAETKVQQKQALRQMSGELEQLYEGWRAELVRLLALMEAYVDFPDEDLPISLSEEIVNTAETVCTTLDQHLQDKRGEQIRDGLVATIVGAPNAGKSSLFNYLAKREAAIVSDVAGTTRDLLEIRLDIGGFPLTLIDTAGLHEAKDDIERQGIARALKQSEHADIVIALFDGTKLPDLDVHTLSQIDERALVVVNKCEQVSRALPNKINECDIHAISVKEKQGLDGLLDALLVRIQEAISPSDSPVFTRERHRQNLQETAHNLEKFLASVENDAPIELAIEDLRLAAVSLGKITGKIEVEELLDEIFLRFCIGK